MAEKCKLCSSFRFSEYDCMVNLVGKSILFLFRIKYGKFAREFTFGPIMTKHLEVTYIHSDKRNMQCINFTFSNIVQVS